MKIRKVITLFLVFGLYQDLFLKNKQHLSCSATYKFPDGTKYGVAHHDVDRAGVILVVPTGIQSRKQFEKYGVIVGHDKNLKSWMIGQAGKMDSCDCSSAVTASRELLEETGGFFKMSAANIAKLPYIYAGNKQMFLYLSKDLRLLSLIKDAVKKVQGNMHIDKSYQEIDDVEVVTLKNLLDLANKIDQGLIQKGQYYVTTVSGKKIQLDTWYTQIFAHSYDHDRLKYGTKILEALVA
ncbi:hypothetical protein HYV10_03405 [Candidatus Dependentiae bacterium]|nr:hypothetical protein [Candidatus Dependentiae bacterium]